VDELQVGELDCPTDCTSANGTSSAYNTSIRPRMSPRESRRRVACSALLLGLLTAALLPAANAISVIVPAHDDECFYEQVRGF
jgi:hypothetical protein